MTQAEHPSVEQISDLVAGVLPAAESMDLNAHLASCTACADERDALLDLTALLAAEGASTLEMPPDISASIAGAIDRASAERAATRPSTDRPSSPSGRQAWRRLAGAAAAVLVVGVGFAGLRALPQQGSDSAGTATSGGVGLAPHRQADGQSSGGQVDVPPGTPSAVPEASGGAPSIDLNKAEVASSARRLALSEVHLVAPQSAGCATPISGGTSTVVRFQGHPAVLTITPGTRLATIYDCATATKTLFITGY